MESTDHSQQSSLQDNTTVDAAAFAWYANRDSSAWKAIVDQRVVHSKFGSGTIVALADGPAADQSVLTVRFDKPVHSDHYGTKRDLPFIASAMNGKAFVELTLPFELVETIQSLSEEREREQKRREAIRAEVRAVSEEVQRQKQREATDRQEFARLKRKYQVDWFSESAPISRLYPILLKLEGHEGLTCEETNWLKARNVHSVLAYHYQGQGLLAAAGSRWRKARTPRPRRALRITEGIDDDHMVLTMRGGAYRDLALLDKAEESGKKAIELKPDDYHPYNLLGAVYYQRGHPGKGDAYFAKARKLGSPERSVEDSIRSAINKAGENEKKIVAQYLINRDPERYGWARAYL